MNMRSRKEIAAAYAALSTALDIHDTKRDVFLDGSEPAARMVKDTLCWVLGHDHPTCFEVNLDSLRQLISAESAKPEEPKVCEGLITRLLAERATTKDVH
jgi:hypothetical protein